MDITTFYNGLSSLAWHITKHNVLIIGRDMNSQIEKDENKSYLHKLPNRNGEYLTDFSSLNPKFQKREEKLSTSTFPNNTKAQVDYILVYKYII